MPFRTIKNIDKLNIFKNKVSRFVKKIHFMIPIP